MTSIAAPSAERLRTAIDRRVFTARLVHGLGAVGRIGCVAACVWAIAVVADRIAGGRVDARLVACTVLAAAAIAAWFFARRAIASWPTRLSLALAAERAQPELGERISRAIDFLDETAADGDGSTTLKALAISQAADAADRIVAVPIDGASRHVGFAAAAAVALSLLAIAGTRRDAVTTHATIATESPAADSSPATIRPTFDPLSAAGQAAARIAALAGFERRLANSLASWFAEAPGLAAIDAPPRRRLAIADAAALHDDVMAGVSSAADAIGAAAANSDATALSKAMAELAADVDSAQSDVSAAIRDHRLAAAADAASRLADRLAKAASLLGIPMIDPGGEVLAEQPSMRGNERESPDHDSSAIIDRLAQLDRAVASASAPEGAAITEPGAASQSKAPAAAAPGPGGGASAEAPQAGGLAPGADGIERVWSLVPQHSLPLRPRAADAATFPSHRRAIDAYYRLLLEQERSKP
jgi:hypothetical protein